MIHNEFIRVLASDLGTSQKEARRLVEAVVGVIYLGLARDARLEIHGLGRFKITESPARMMRSGITGETSLVPGSKRTTFSMAAPLRRALRGEEAR
jgi:nucleoid DNA-binding protein